MGKPQFSGPDMHMVTSPHVVAPLSAVEGNEAGKDKGGPGKGMAFKQGEPKEVRK